MLADCRVDTFRAGGKGGQHQNTTESGVRLTHLPTGIVVTTREERSQHRNKAIALRRLRDRLAELETIKRRRIATRIPAREKRSRLAAKKKQSNKKELRKPPDPEDG